jgi:hypothetical protein
MPQKHDNYTRKVLYGIGDGGGVGVVKAITRTASAVKNEEMKKKKKMSDEIRTDKLDSKL